MAKKKVKENSEVGKCDFCGEDMDALPHKCKYCGKIHCSKHLLPENHQCIGLKNIKKSLFNPKHKKAYQSFDSDYEKVSDYPSTIEHIYQGHHETPKEMYHPSGRGFDFNFKNPFRNIFSFHLSHTIRNALTQFTIALFIGLVLNYVYYQNFSLHYLFIGGVQDWFTVLMDFLNYGIIGGYSIFYLIINGLFYYYLFSTTVVLFYATITNLNKKGTWWFLIGLAILVFVIFKYFPNLIY